MFHVIKCTVEADDYKEATYGVMFVDDDNSKRYFCNLSTNRNEIDELVRLMNRYCPDSCHIPDIIEDYLFSKKTE